MVLTRKLAGSVKYIVFGALFYNAERKKKVMFLKEVDFVGSVSTKIKFILIHNAPQLSLLIRNKVSLYASTCNFIPRLKDFIDVNDYVFRY